MQEKGKWTSCVSTGVYTLSKKKLSCCSTEFYKIISFTAGILDSPSWNNTSNVWQESNQSDFYSLEQKVFSLSSYLLTDKKKSYLPYDIPQYYYNIHNIPHAYWRNSVAYKICHRVDICKLVKLLASSFY